MAGLLDALVGLAGAREDDPAVGAYLHEIVELIPATVPVVDSASVTVPRNGRYVTLASSDELADCLDEAQYGAAAGPCLEALRREQPVAVPEATEGIEWPQFREQAMSTGLFAALSIPLYVGSGTAVASLNLYARRPEALSGLIVAVLGLYHPDGRPDPKSKQLDEGAKHLVEALAAALHVYDDIQHALGMLMAQRGLTAAGAYVALCDLARAQSRGLHAAALDHLARADW